MYSCGHERVTWLRYVCTLMSCLGANVAELPHHTTLVSREMRHLQERVHALSQMGADWDTSDRRDSDDDSLSSEFLSMPSVKPRRVQASI